MLEAVHDHPHADTETILTAVRNGLPDVSRQAVYDVLNALTAVGSCAGSSRWAWLPAMSRASATTTITSCADLRHHRRHRLRGRRRAVSDPVRRRQRAGGLRARRGRSHLLGSVPQLFDRNVSITTVITAHFTHL